MAGFEPADGGSNPSSATKFLGRCIFQFKRIISILLTICFLISISVVPAFAASSDGSAPSYTAINPSEEMQFMTSGEPVSTYATNDAGYRLELNGVEQKHSYTSVTTETVVETAPSGFAYYDGFLLPVPNWAIENFLFVCYRSSWSYYHFCSFPNADPYYQDGYLKIDAGGSGAYLGTFKFRNYDISSQSWSNWSTSQNSSFSRDLSIYDYIFFFEDVFDKDGNVVFPAGTISSTCSVDKEILSEVSNSFLFADYSNFSAVDRTLSLTGSPVTGEISGDQTYSFTASNPYIDVELPVSAWVADVPAAEDYWSFSVDGTLAFDFAIGLQSKVAGEDKYYYALSDLVPSSWQLICNGSLMEDGRCSGTFDSVTPTDDGYSASLTMSTGELNLGSVSSGEYGTEPETLGFRIYLTSASGGTETTITNTYTFESVTPYAYVSFNDADGNSGLPVLTFYEDYDSGTLSGSGNPDDYSVSVYDFGFNYGFYTTVNADSGNYFYGGYQYSAIPSVSGYSYVTILRSGSITFLWLSKTLPYWDGDSVYMGATVGSDYYVYSYSNSEWKTWPSGATASTPNLTYVNYVFKDADGNVLMNAMSPSSTGPSATSMSLTAGGALDNCTSKAGYVSGYGVPITYASVGNTGSTYKFANGSMTGYIDVTYPAETFGVMSTDALLNLVLSGNLAVRARVFPTVVDSDSGSCAAPYYIDNPYSVQIIFNDTLFSDEYLLNYITDDPSVASVSGLDMSFDNITYLDTVTFRFNYSVDAQSTAWMTMESLLSGGDSFTIGADCEILTSPVFTAEVDENAAARFDDTNIVNWLKKIHAELTTYFPEFSSAFESIIEQLTTQTDVLNDILEALKDNSALEGVSSTVTNIYNSVSNVETSISNVESTINNVSTTVNEMSSTVSGMQQTQQEMQETQQEMEEDTSALRDVYASESDVEFKSATEDMSSGAYEALLGNSETGEEKLDVSDPKDLKNVGNKVKGWFSFDVSFSDLFDLVEGDTLSGWFSETNASQIDSVVSIQTYGLDDDPYNHQSYDDYLSLIFSTFGGD